MKYFLHLGNNDPDYRGIMERQTDFHAGGKLIPALRTVIAEQTHSDLVHVCSESDSGAGFGSHPQISTADGFISNIPNQYLLIRTADCTPVIFVDKQLRAVGAVHSGREGTRKNIAGKAVRLLGSEYGIAPTEILAWIGAGICQQHYPVADDVWYHYVESMQALGLDTSLQKKPFLNIRLSIFQQLISSGIPFRNIEQDSTCTWESACHFSWRRDGSRNRQINIVGLEDE